MSTRQKMNQAIDRLKRVDKGKEDLEKKLRFLYEEREKILEGISEGKDKFRITEITKEVVEIRRKIARTLEIKTVLEKYNVSIDDVALISCWRERLALGEFETRWPSSHFGDFTGKSTTLTDPNSNKWIISERYLYGGPGDKVKVFFDRSKNNQYYICGFITNFPLKAA